MPNKLINRKENLVSIVITLLFVLGFLILINYGPSITSLGVLDNSTLDNIILNNTLIQSDNLTLNETINLTENINQTLNENISEENNLFEFETQAAGDQVVKIWWPENNTDTYARAINFTFNVTDSDNYINNCTLFLNINGTGFDKNITTIIGTNYTNLTDGFNTSLFAGSSATSWGVTTNGTDLWTTDYTDDWIFHVNKSGYNFTGTLSETGFSASFAGTSPSPIGITTNGTDFWIVDSTDDWIYHVNKSGYNFTGTLSETGFLASFAGTSPLPYSITTNGSDLWIADNTDDWIYHVNKSGYNFTGTLSEPGFSASFAGTSPYPTGITTPSLPTAEGGAPKEFWIADTTDDYIYHIKKVITEDMNQTFNKTFDSLNKSVYWKVGCRDDNNIEVNSSIFNLSLILTADTTDPIVNAQYPFNNTNWTTPYINFTYNVTDAGSNIDTCILWLNKQGTWQLNKTNSTIAETVNQSINITINDQNMLWLVECNDTANNKANSTIRNITVDTTNPIINSQFPLNNTNWSNSYINFTYNVSDNFEVKNCSVYLLKNNIWQLNITNITITEVVNQSLNVTVNDQNMLWKVGCYDSALNQYNSTARNITIDTTNPVVNLQFPKNNTNYSTSYVNFTYNVTDSLLDIDSCILWLNKQGTWQLNKTNSTITETINQSINITVDDQNMLWRVECNDTLNNRGNSTTYNLTIDTIPPQIYLESPDNNTINTTDSTPNFIFNATDDQASTLDCTLWLDNGTVFAADGNASSVSGIFTTLTANQTLANDDYWWWINCSDRDNENKSEIRNISINVNFPTAQLIYPLNDSIDISIPVDLTVNVRDLDNDLINVSFYGSSMSEFISRSGNNFTLNGSRFRFLGTNSYYLSDYATNMTYDDEGNQVNNSRAYVLEILDEAESLGLNVIRTWASMQGGGRGNTSWNQSKYGGHFNLFENNVPGNFNETMFKALDYVIYEASKRDIRLLLVLVNNWNDYGGMRWYAQQSPTTDKTNENVSDTSLATYWQFHDQFYNDTYAMQYYMNYTNYTLNRNNTYSGKLYKNDPAIFAWSLTNEARAKSDGNRSGGLLLDWIENMSAYVKSIDSNHLVTVGIEGWGTPWEGTALIIDHNVSDVDFVTFSLYPDQWNWFAEWSKYANGSYVGKEIHNASIDWWTNDTDVTWDSPNTYEPDLADGGFDNWVKQNIDWAEINLSKPVVLQEFGLNKSYSNDLRSKFYNQTIHSFFSNGGDGLLFWTLNHDDYYYGTDVDGIMDDGYGFYVSTDDYLKNKSKPILESINFTNIDNDGESWIDIPNFIILCENTSSVSSETEVICMWDNLSYSTTYEWYVNVTDGKLTTNSITWNFTTKNLTIASLPPEEQGVISKPPPPPPEPEPEPTPEPEPEPEPTPTPPSEEAEEVGQEIGIPEMNLDPGFSNILKNMLSGIKVPDEPRIPVITIINKTLIINLNQTRININFTAERPSILIQETISAGEKPKKTKILFKKLFVILLILLILIVLYYIIKLYPNYKKHYLTIDGFLEKINSEIIRSIKSIIIRKKEFKPIIIELTEDVKKQINRHESLLRLIKINISKNSLDLANKQYEELISIYKYLILKLNGKDLSKIYNIMRNVYYELKIANEIYYYKKKLK